MNIQTRISCQCLIIVTLVKTIGITDCDEYISCHMNYGCMDI